MRVRASSDDMISYQNRCIKSQLHLSHCILYVDNSKFKYLRFKIKTFWIGSQLPISSPFSAHRLRHWMNVLIKRKSILFGQLLSENYHCHRETENKRQKDQRGMA